MIDGALSAIVCGSILAALIVGVIVDVTSRKGRRRR
jgi:hypothetical protein